MGRHKFFTIVLLLFLLRHAATTNGAELGTSTYTAPLIGGFEVRRADLSENSPAGLYAILADNGTDLPMPIIENLKQLAIFRNEIIGQTDTQFFIIDTRLSNSKPILFNSSYDWKSALAKKGIPKDMPLISPDEFAAALPDRVVHPLNYRRMNGMCGWSDTEWVGSALLIGHILALAVGFFRKFASSLYLACSIAVLLDVVIDVSMRDDGSGFFFDLFSFSASCCLFAIVGKGLNILGRAAYGLKTQTPKPGRS